MGYGINFGTLNKSLNGCANWARRITLQALTNLPELAMFEIVSLVIL